MKRTPVRVPLVLAAAALALAPAVAAAREHRELSESFQYLRGQTVRLDFPVGELEIEASSGDKVEVELRAECRWDNSRCYAALEDVRIVSRSSDRRLSIEIEGDKNWGRGKLELEGTIRVPRQAELDVEFGIGELEIDDFEGDVRVDMGIGDVTVRADASKVRSVDIDAGIGEATLSGVRENVRGRRSLLIGAEVSWDDGSGGSRIVVDLGIGDAKVRLH